MPLALEEYLSIEKEVVQRVKINLNNANQEDSIEDYLVKIGIEQSICKYQTSYVKNAKIIVFGSSNVSVDILKKSAENLGFDSRLFEFHLDYKKNKHYDFSILRNNVNYSDILIGPNAHKSVNIGDNPSAIDMIQRNPEEYPKLTKIITENGQLKITTTSFRNALMNTQAYRNLY